MIKLVNVASGARVNVPADLAARLGSGWVPVPLTTDESTHDAEAADEPAAAPKRPRRRKSA